MAAFEDSVGDVFAQGGTLRDDVFQDDAARAIEMSLEFARKTRWDSVRSPHIFMGLLAVNDAAIQVWGDKLGADVGRLIEQFQELFLQEMGDPDAVLRAHREFFSDNVIRLLRDAHQRALDHGRRLATPMDLLIVLFTTSHSIVAECFERIGVTAAKLTELAVIAEQASLRPA